MATLTGKLISNTYKDLLQVSNNNDGVDSTVRFVSDGEGTNSALKISNSEVETTGKLTVGAALSASGKITGDSATVITAVCASTYFGDGSNLTGVVASIPTSVTSFTANQLTVVSGAAFTGKVSGTAAEFSGIVSAGTFAGAAGIFTGKVSGTTLAMTGEVSASTFSGVGATFSGNVTAASYFGDGSNLTGVEASAATSVAAFTANQLTVVSGASFTGKVSGTAAEFSGNVSAANLFASTNVFVGGTAVPTASDIAAVSALTSVNKAAITSINSILGDGSNFATSAELAAVSSALATSIGNSNTNIAAVSALTSVNLAAITSINSILGDGSNFATSAELAAVSSALATSIGNSNTNIAAVSVLTSVNLAAITSINSAALLKASNLSDLNSASTSRTNLGVAIGSDVEAFNADILKADEADELTAGFSAAAHSAGTKSSGTYTPDVDDGNFQFATNGGAHTLGVPSKNCTMVILYKNNASAGTITTSGYTKVDGDTISTTNGDEFFFYITRINDGSTTFSMLTVKALQ